MRLRALKWLVRDTALAAGYCTGVSSLYNRLAGRRAGIVTYHNVLPRERLGSGHRYQVDVSAEVFEAQIRYLATRWPMLPAEALGSDAPGFVLTFDDGMQNAATIAAPILARYGMTAVFAVCPSLVDGEIPYTWRDHFFLLVRGSVGRSLRLPDDEFQSPTPVRADNVDVLCNRIRDYVVANRVEDVYALIGEFARRNDLSTDRTDQQPDRFWPMTWEMIDQLRSAGHRIASHTCTHRMLSLLSPEQKRWELEHSRQVLAQRLGQSVDAIVYPYGFPQAVDAQSMQMAEAAGYRLGLMNVPVPPPAGPGMSVGRFALPSTAYRPHLHAVLSGLKQRLKLG